MTTPTSTKAPKTVPASPAGPSKSVTPQNDAGPKLCGAPVQKMSEGKPTGESAPCIKAAGHDKDPKSKHSWRAYTRVNTDAVSVDAIAVEAVPTTERLTEVQERERSDAQKMIDQHVKDAHAKWVAAGKPAGFNAAIAAGAGMRYTVTDENVEAFRSMLRKASNLIGGVWVRTAPIKRDINGGKMLYWIATDRKERTKK